MKRATRGGVYREGGRVSKKEKEDKCGMRKTGVKEEEEC